MMVGRLVHPPMGVLSLGVHLLGPGGTAKKPQEPRNEARKDVLSFPGHYPHPACPVRPSGGGNLLFTGGEMSWVLTSP